MGWRPYWTSRVASDYTYLIQAGGHDGPVKIGRSTDPQKRLKQLQSGSPHELYLMHAIISGHHEAELHRLYAHLHIRGEWYDAGVLDHIGTRDYRLQVNGEIQQSLEAR